MALTRIDELQNELACLDKYERACEQSTKDARKLTEQREKQIEELQGKLKDKHNRKSRAEEDGLDTTPLQKQIDEIKREIESLKRLSPIRTAAVVAPPGLRGRKEIEADLKAARQMVRDTEDVAAAAQLMAELGYDNIPTINSLDECALSIKVYCDKDYPNMFRNHMLRYHYTFVIDFGSATQTVKASRKNEQIIPYHVPDGAYWLREAIGGAQGPGPSGGKIRVWLLNNHQYVFSSRGDNNHWDNKTLLSRLGGGTEHAERFRTLIESRSIFLTDRFNEELGTIGGEVDLDSAGGGPLVRHVRLRMKEIVPHRLSFVADNAVATSDDIYKTIKTHWDAIAKSPWSDEIKGSMASLKLYLENGEKVRFWKAGYQNYYGFRLRTRDHSWLVGEFFIDTVNPQANNSTMTVWADQRRTPPTYYAKIGAMTLQVDEERDRDRWTRY